MILTTHALTGAVVGKYIPNIGLIAVVSFILHFALDHLRHGEYLNRQNYKNGFRKSVIDLVVAFLILFLIFNFKNFSKTEAINMLLGSFFSMFPDLLTLFYWKFKIEFLRPLYSFHTRVHKYPVSSPERVWNFRNAANDIILSLAAIILLLWL